MAGLRDILEYWKNDNAQFEASNPSILARIGRAVNPLTGVGSGYGQIYKGSEDNNPNDMAMGAWQVMPTAAVTKFVPSPAWAKEIGTVVPDGLRTLLKYGTGVGMGVAYDEANAAPKAPPPPPPPPVTTYTPRNASLGIRG